MSKYSVIKVAAYARRIAGLFERFTAELQGKGFNTAAFITKLNADADVLTSTDETQEHAKSVQKNSTSTVEERTAAAYRKASNALKSAAGFFGKRTPEAQETVRLRNGVANESNAAQVAEFVRSSLAFLTTHTAALAAKGYDTAPRIAELTALAGTLVTDKNEQMTAMHNRDDATDDVLSERDSLYDYANNTLNGAISLYDGDPNANFVQEARTIRLELNTPTSRGEEPPAPAPAPAPQPPAA